MFLRFNIWNSLPTTFFAATVVMMLSSGHSLSAQELNASDGAEGDFFGGFGGSGLSGNTALISANGDDDNGSSSGSAYLFRNLDTATGTVNESVKLLPSDGAERDGDNPQLPGEKRGRACAAIGVGIDGLSAISK